MIALVVILLSVFSAALYNYLPTDRDPSITVLKTNDRQNVTLWHKGGDWVKIGDLTVIISNETEKTIYKQSDSEFFFVPPDPHNRPNYDLFDLNSSITVRTSHVFEGNETIRLVTSRAVIYTGRITL